MHLFFFLKKKTQFLKAPLLKLQFQTNPSSLGQKKELPLFSLIDYFSSLIHTKG
jgi:hypothetical protein